jgi:phosphate transport system permease protein
VATAIQSSATFDPADDLRRGNTAGLRWRTGFDRWIGYLIPILFLVALVPIIDVIYYLATQALPTLTWTVVTSFRDWQSQDALGVAIVSTFEFMAFATAIAVGIGVVGGVATAEFLSEQAAGWVRMAANMLAGMPSVIVGYFGYFAFVLYFHWGLNFIAGVVTLSFFMCPYVFRTVDLAYSSVPRPIREAALGSGARPGQYIFRIGTAIAFPQILTGIFLAMAIGVGETAPIILTVQPGVLLPSSLLSPALFGTYLIWTGFDQPPGVALTLAFQTAFLIIVVVLVLNVLVRVISARYRKRLEGLYQ